MKFSHQPVLVKEVLAYLQPQANENFVDCTVGGGGHAKEILQKNGPNGCLLGIDLDEQAILAAQTNLAEYQKRVTLVKDNYKNLQQILHVSGFNKIDGILLDLGLSSFELEDPERGFSFQGSAVLDMRFGSNGQTASDVVNNYREDDLAKIFREYGEERHSGLIAKALVQERKKTKIVTNDQLVAIIEKVYQSWPKPKHIHVATKVFQALRIEVNQELANIKSVLPQVLSALVPGGRLVVISFHSLEDKIVKEFFKQESRDCLCPPVAPICQCQHKKQVKILTKKVVMASGEEISSNPRSRSAKLRAIIKI